jgi:uncharacterized protein YgiB involved in biofilm formation
MADWRSDDDRSGSVWSALIGIGIVALTWLTDWWREEHTVRRDLYASKEDCLKDWGDERNCEPEYASGLRSGTGLHYYGPPYNSGQYGSPLGTRPDGTIDTARPGSHAMGTAHVARGGFGGTGAAHGSLGS